MGYLYEACDQISDFCHQQLLRKIRRKMSIYVQCVYKSTKSTNRKQGSDGSKNASHDMGYLYEACDQISDLCHQQLLRKMRRQMCIYMLNVYTNQLSRQTGSRNLTGPKTLPTIWHTYIKLVTKYQIPIINSCLEKCDEKCEYTNVCQLNVYKNQQNRQTGSRNLMGPKTLPTIWGTYMKLVTKYQISAINSC